MYFLSDSVYSVVHTYTWLLIALSIDNLLELSKWMGNFVCPSLNTKTTGHESITNK